MELIDKQKLLEWVNRNIDANQLSQGGIALKILREKVESGTFDDHSAQEEIAKLKKELNVSDLAHEQAERDFEKWKARAIQAESDKRDAMVSLLKGDRLIEKLWEDLRQAEQELDKLRGRLEVAEEASEIVSAKADARVIRAEQERDKLREENGDFAALLTRYQQDGVNQAYEIHQLKKVRSALIEGLKWYADQDNYDSGYTRYDADDEPTGFESYVEEDYGERARSIIAKIEQ